MYKELINKEAEKVSKYVENIKEFMKDVREYSGEFRMDEEIMEDYIYEVVYNSIEEAGYSGVIYFKGGEVSVDEVGIMEMALKKALKEENI